MKWQKFGNELATVPISALCYELLNLVTRLDAKVVIKIQSALYYNQNFCAPYATIFTEVGAMSKSLPPASAADCATAASSELTASMFFFDICILR